MAKIAIVVPCYNEAERLDAAAFSKFEGGADRYTFWFVNDGSTDGTKEMLDRMCGADGEKFRAVHLERNLGKAEAVRRGMLEALKSDAEYVGFWDADLATPLSALPCFMAVMGERPWVEMVFGARVQMLGREIVRGTARHYLGRFVATATSWTLGIPVYDTQCGAKVFRRTEQVAGLFAEPFITRWLFDVEVVARRLATGGSVQRGRECIYELPLDSWRDVGNSKVKPWEFFRAFYDLWRIRRRHPVKRQTADGRG